MGSLAPQIYEELKRTSHSASHVLLVFLSLMVVFGVVSSNHPTVWQAFLPTLLMGLSYGVISLSLDQLFREDWEDGTLEWWMSEGKSIEAYGLTKILVHWIRLGIPLSGLVGIITDFTSFALIGGVAITTLTLMFQGAIASALCLNAKDSKSILLPLLTLPLGIPIMIVSMAAFNDPTAGIGSYFSLQGGLLFTERCLIVNGLPLCLAAVAAVACLFKQLLLH